MPMDLGALVNGFTGGMDSGQAMMLRRRQMQEQARVQAAQRAIAQGQINSAGGGGAPAGPAGGGMTNVPMPGATPMPQGPQAPAGPPQGAIGAPGAPPMANVAAAIQQLLSSRKGGDMGGTIGGGGAPANPNAPIDIGAAPRPGSGPTDFGVPPRPAGPSQGTTPAAGAQSAQPPAFSGVVQSTGNVLQDSQTTVNRVFQELIKQNPDLKKDPQLLFAAAEQQIGLMKGVSSEVKDAMMMQLGYGRLQTQAAGLAERAQYHMQQTQTRLKEIDAKLKIANQSDETKRALAAERDRLQRDLEADRAAVQMRGQDLGFDAREDATDERAAATEATLNERGRESDNTQATGAYRAQAGSAGTNAPPPKLESKRPTQLPRTRRRTYIDEKGNPVTPGAGNGGAPPKPPDHPGQVAKGPSGTWVAKQVKGSLQWAPQ